MDHVVPSGDEVREYLVEARNWGRWGADDDAGTINLITPEKKVAAAGLVRVGRSVSLTRPFPTHRGPENPAPAVEFWTRTGWGFGGGHAGDYIGIGCHGLNSTHLDAICHLWDQHGIYNGRDPDDVISFEGARFGGIDAWSEGIFTRGVVVDVPRYRGTPYVELGEPVHGWELDEILTSRGVAVEPGDALCVYSGRERWQEDNPDKPYGVWRGEDGQERTKPGLHASCLPFLRDNDVGVLVWDMMDEWPIEYDISWTVHGAIHSLGLALLDNALLEPLADACREEGRDEFLFTVTPLLLPGGTGSPVNPIAIF